MRTYNVWLGPVYNIPRSQADTEAPEDPAIDAEANGEFFGRNLVIKGTSRLIPHGRQMTVTTTAGNKTLTAVSLGAGTDSVSANHAFLCPGFPAGTTVASYNAGAAQITLNSSANCTTSATGVAASSRYPITVFPSCASGASGVVEFIKLQAQPEGPVVLIVDWCCPARALLRVGTTTIWGIRVRNSGGIKATGIGLSFANLSTGLAASAANTVFEDIPPDEDRTFFFEVTSTAYGSFLSLDVTVTCDQGDSVTAIAARGWYYGAKPAGLTAGVVPPPGTLPTKPADCPLIGVWLFPPWRGRGAAIGHTFERRPELGYASYERQEFWKWHIKWLAEHGVDYLLVEWIERIRKTGFNKDINKNYARDCVDNGLLPALEAVGFVGKIKFEINYVCQNDDVALPRNQLNSDIEIYTGNGPPGTVAGSQDNDYYLDTTVAAGVGQRLYGPKAGGSWNTAYYVTTPPGTTRAKCFAACNFLEMFRRQVPYFTHPAYLYTPGPTPKARYSFFNANTGFYVQITAPLGDDDYAGNKTDDNDLFVQTLLARANRLAIVGGVTNGMSWGAGQTAGGKSTDGLPGATPQDRANGNSDFWSGLGFDRCSYYGLLGVNRVANVEDAAKTQAAMDTAWDDQENIAHGIRPQLYICGGFDHHRWQQAKRMTSWTIVGWDYDRLKDHMNAAKAFFVAKGIPNAQREILCTALDEYGEGSIFAPVAQNGFKFLQAIREVWYPDATAPTIIGPADVYATPAAFRAALPQDAVNLFRWVATPTAYPDEDVNTNTKEGVQVPGGSYPAVHPARNVSSWVVSSATNRVEPTPAVGVIPMSRGVNATGAILTGARMAELGVNIYRRNFPVLWTRNRDGSGRKTAYNTPVVGKTGNFGDALPGITAWVDSLDPSVTVVWDPHHCPGFPTEIITYDNTTTPPTEVSFNSAGGTSHADYPLSWYFGFAVGQAEYWRQLALWCIGRTDRKYGFDLQNEPNQPCQSNDGAALGRGSAAGQHGIAYPELVTAATQPTQAYLNGLHAAWVAKGGTAPTCPRSATWISRSAHGTRGAGEQASC
ncbi:MAG: hypothetical protein IPK75_18885 [Acidobacteria bacterium]|nr:hypothetical protein [Acidobacteriota bacterium]